MLSSVKWSTPFFIFLQLLRGGSTACHFEETEDRALYAHNDFVLSDVSVSECKEACLQMTDFECLSFDYQTQRGNCYLSRDNSETAPEYMGPHHNSIYYEKVCISEETDEPPEPPTTEESPTEEPGTTPDTLLEMHCRQDQLGRGYIGHQSYTDSGKTCQRWDSQYPHEHNMRPENFPERSLTAAENYCRNPDSEAGGPWCYTTDSDTRWEYCMIPFCPGAEIHQECKIDRIGNSYRGYQTTTRTGRTCQRWTSQSPHQHSMTWKGFPEGNMEAAMNYCRNPDREPDGPWCYTTDPEVRWEYCDIPMC